MSKFLVVIQFSKRNIFVPLEVRNQFDNKQIKIQKCVEGMNLGHAVCTDVDGQYLLLIPLY